MKLKKIAPHTWGKGGLIAALLLMPTFLQAQTLGGSIHGLQAELDLVYQEMIPLCSRLIGVGRGIAGFGALWYIAFRVWSQIANAKPIDLYPLLRPFALGMALLMFPSVLALINGVLQPTVAATGSMVKDSNKAITVLLKKKEDAIKKTDTWQMYVGTDGSGDRDRWYKYTHPEDPTGNGEGMFESVGNDMKFAMAKASYNFRNSIKEWMSEVLEILYQAASLCINTIRTFYLIVLAILGPLVFGFAVFDGFQHTLTVWLGRYINIFLWLPVSNIFGSIIGKVQENMLKLDISQVQSSGDTFFSSTDTAYLIFLVIGIVGYFTVPSVANYIVHAGGGNALLQKVNSLMSSSTKTITDSASGMTQDVFGGKSNMSQGMANRSVSDGYFGNGSNNEYQRNRLAGN